MDRDISPPPLKRRKVEGLGAMGEDKSLQDPVWHLKPDSTGPTSPRCIRLFSWNINGIQPFLPTNNASITSFFKPLSPKERRPFGSSVSPRGTPKPSASVGNPLREFLRRHGWPQIVFLQELKISPLDRKTPTTFLSAINTPVDTKDDIQRDRRYTLDVNLPRDKHNARGFGGKLYGVGTVLREDFASEYVTDVRHADWDLEGRITIVELRCGQRTSIDVDPAESIPKANDHVTPNAAVRPLALLNVYAVNGTAAPYRSPDTGKVAGTRHDHKLAFHTRLRDECLALESRGFSVVIAGDLNIARGRLDGHPSLRTYPRQHCLNRADFNAKFFSHEDNARAEAYTGELSEAPEVPKARFDGVDVFRALKGKERRYTYHPRSGDDWGSSCDRVDFIVVSKALFESGRVVKTDILDSPQERGTSDHVPLMLELKLDESAS